MRGLLGVALIATAHAARFSPVHTVVKDRGGVVHVRLVPTEGGGVLHLRMTGKRISRVAAKKSIRATTKGIHACETCTAVVEMGECRGVSPLALPTTAHFLLSHPSLKHILIIEAKGAVLLACRTVKRLSGHDKFDIYRSWSAFEAACSSNRAVHRRVALAIARKFRPRESHTDALSSWLWGVVERSQGAADGAASWLETRPRWPWRRQRAEAQ